MITSLQMFLSNSERGRASLLCVLFNLQYLAFSKLGNSIHNHSYCPLLTANQSVGNRGARKEEGIEAGMVIIRMREISLLPLQWNGWNSIKFRFYAHVSHMQTPSQLPGRKSQLFSFSKSSFSLSPIKCYNKKNNNLRGELKSQKVLIEGKNNC